MNKVLSVLKLYFTETYKRLLLVLLFMTVADLGLYFLRIAEVSSFSELINQCHVSLIFALGCILMVLGNMLQKNKVSRYAYTYQRLRISERSAFLLQCLAYTVNLIAVYLYQLMLIYVLYRLYMPLGYESAVNVFAEFMSNSTLMVLVPMFTNKQWLITPVMLILGGICSASRAVRQRYDKWDFGTPALVQFIVNLNKIRNYEYILVVLFAVLVVSASFVLALQLTHDGKRR
ncbi:MAG: hypothetical protein E7186_01775 [Erysipelotrichaceae bacterium]|nr:hypothetical protein [Erysipelotrichaceae bacterium]